MPDQNASQTKQETEPKPPTAEDIGKAQQVAQAGGDAAESGQDPAQAMKDEAKRVQLDIPDEVIDKMASAISDRNIQALEQRGAFDTPPEPVQGPDQAEQEPQHPAEQGEHAAESDERPPAPVKRTWAHKFLGVE